MRKPTKQEVWHHNSLLGAAGMIKACAQRVVNAKTSTDRSKQQAAEIITLACVHAASLKTRRDQE